MINCIKYLCIFLVVSLLGSNISPTIIKIDPNQNSNEVVVITKEDADIVNITNFINQLKFDLTIKSSSSNCFLIELNPNVNYEKLKKELLSNDGILVVQPNYSYSLDANINDPYFSLQWALQSDSYNDIDVDAKEAWDYYDQNITSKRQVIVAILDTGVDYQHPDLAANMWKNPYEIPNNLIDDDNNGYVDDIYGWDFYNGDSSVCHYNNTATEIKPDLHDNDMHGTHCAGIIAGAVNNKVGITGLASNIDVKIMSVKMAGGSESDGTTYAAILGIQYADSMGADICNMSWESNYYDEALEQVMKNSKMLFVAAAGNHSQDLNESPVYPACFELNNLITVGSVDESGEFSHFSNYGKKYVHVAAPGENILSTIVNDYKTLSGTSMATPFVSAIAAMLYSTSDGLYASSVKDVILRSSKQLPSLEDKVMTYGLVSAYKSLQNSRELNSDMQAPNIILSYSVISNHISINSKIEDKGNSGLRILKWEKGNKSLDYFKKEYAGNTLYNSTSVFETIPGTYTFYACDYSGNETVTVIDALIIPSTKITLNKTKATLKVGKTMTLIPTITPKKSTDKITFTSSNKNIATVNSSGKITAKKAGTAKITAKTTSGKKFSCSLTVK